MLHSDFRWLANVRLPEPTLGRRHYMHSFEATKPTVPAGYEDYLSTVKALVKVAEIRSECHLTIDEKVVKAGMSQRRPGPHVDGCFIRGRGWGHSGNEPQWFHDCNNIHDGAFARMAVIVAASVPGCRAWLGEFDGEPKGDGDLSHIAKQLGEGVVLPANQAFLLSPDCVHESMVFDIDTPRTFLRIAFGDVAQR